MNTWLRPAAVAVLLAGGALAAAQPAPLDDDDPLGERAGGDTTVFATGRNAFSFPLATLSDAERTRFVLGNSFFRRNWVEAPSSTAARDGLGPHFIARSCGGCHLQDGRGAPPLAGGDAPPVQRRGSRTRAGEAPVGLLLRLSVPGAGPHGAVVPEPTYGDQFNNAAIQGVKPEGKVLIRHRPVHGRFADGTAYTLQQPIYGFADLAYGPMSSQVMVSPRVAPQLAGVGLLEAIADAEIVRNVEQQALRTDAIKGQVNRVWDEPSGQERIGRFGWKANVATLAHQTAGAFVGDMGVTSTLFPTEPCTAAQKDCLAAPRGGRSGGPEIDPATFEHVVFYEASLAPAARRNVQAADVSAGQRLFEEAQCSACHRPSYVTAAVAATPLSSDKLAGQHIWPYTDLLLHDMGPALADGRPDFLAGASQWKTPPLWGVGLIPDVNGHDRLLHDGRARGVLEAVLWHGGEAEQSRQRVLHMTAAQRAALVKFVESL